MTWDEILAVRAEIDTAEAKKRAAKDAADAEYLSECYAIRKRCPHHYPAEWGNFFCQACYKADLSRAEAEGGEVGLRVAMHRNREVGG